VNTLFLANQFQPEYVSRTDVPCSSDASVICNEYCCDDSDIGYVNLLKIYLNCATSGCVLMELHHCKSTMRGD